MYIRRGRLRRDGLVALLVVCALWYWLWPAPPSEWERLRSWMKEARDLPDTFVKSSFDWNGVRLRFARDYSQTPLPHRRRGAGPPPVVQHDFGRESPEEERVRLARLAEVRRVFRRNWASYREFAWGKDALLPMSGGARDQFSGWAATLVDSLDTLWLMGLRDEFDEAVAAVARIDFGESTSPRVNMFETNIRYLGGLLAAYDLSGRRALLDKAVELGGLLHGGFNTANGMPVDFIDVAAAKTGEGLVVEDVVVSASPGTLSLELARLSQLTGDARYYGAASRAMDVFRRGQNRTALPGVWPMWVSMSREDVADGGAFTMGGSEDSLYEYLPKMHQLLGGSGDRDAYDDGGEDDKYAVMARAFLDTVDRHFLFRPMLPGDDDVLLPGNVNMVDGAPVLDPETEHLACFLGGTFALAGRLLNRPSDVATGARLARGCVAAYRAFPTGMMPERLNTAPCPPAPRGAPCPWDEALWTRARDARPEWAPHLPLGFTTAKDPRYILRPEAIESVFYLHRITGAPEWREAAWDMFVAVSNGTLTEYANAAVLDVTRGGETLPKEDYMESFWLAETLKYFYLVFSAPDVLSLDEFVLNTEAHPFRIPR